MTYVGIIVIFIGVIFIAIGWNTRPAGLKNLLAGVLLALGGTLIGIGGNPSRDMPNGSPGMVTLGFLLTGAGIIIAVIEISKSVKALKGSAAKAADEQKIAFYNECVKNGVTSCSSEKEIQKASLIANQKNLAFTDISALFSECRELSLKTQEAAAAAELEAKRNEEKKQLAELTKYAKFSGRDKRIAMLSDERLAALEGAKTLRAGSNALYQSTHQKELDWAVHGGIASGIAGGAAGLATALDIQQKNAQIRAQNAANDRAFASLYMNSEMSASNYESRAAALAQEIEETKTKLVSNDTAADCLASVTFGKTSVSVSETGTLTVSVKASVKQPFFIFDDVSAVVDGTVIAKIYDGNTLVGTADMVLPMYGLGTDADLFGMSLFSGKKDTRYRVEYAAVNLWSMER